MKLLQRKSQVLANTNFDGYLNMHNWYAAVIEARAYEEHAREMRRIVYGPPHPENPTAYLFGVCYPNGTPLDLDRTLARRATRTPSAHGIYQARRS